MKDCYLGRFMYIVVLLISYRMPFIYLQVQWVKPLARVWACALGRCKQLRITQMSHSGLAIHYRVRATPLVPKKFLLCILGST